MSFHRSVRTVYGIDIINSLATGTRYNQLPNTTLNEKYGVFPDARPENNATPKIGYFAIGIGGRVPQVRPDGRISANYREYRTTNASLYDPIPFIVRPIDQDLDSATRNRYAMRKQIESVDGVPYIAYYLRRLDMSSVDSSIQEITRLNGVETPRPFTPDSSVLNPVPPTIPSTGAIQSTGRYYSATKDVPMYFSPEDIQEAIRAVEIIHGDRNLAVISEIALVAGVDRMMSASSVSGTLSYKEAVSATVVSFTVADTPLVFTNRGFELTASLGAGDPLLDVEVINTASVGP